MTVVTIDNEASESTSETTSNNSRWWFRFFLFSPLVNWSNLTSIFFRWVETHNQNTLWSLNPSNPSCYRRLCGMIPGDRASHRECLDQGSYSCRGTVRNGGNFYGSLVISPKEIKFSMSFTMICYDFSLCLPWFIYASRSQRLGWVPYMHLFSESFCSGGKRIACILDERRVKMTYEGLESQLKGWLPDHLPGGTGDFLISYYILAHRTSPDLESDSGTKFGSIFDWSLGLSEGWSLRRIWKTDSM